MRHAILTRAALIQLVCLSPLSSLPAQEVGDRVAVKADGELTVDGRIVQKLLAGDTMEVKKIERDRLWVRSRASGWIARADVLSLDNAVDHFTMAIRDDPTNAAYYVARGKAWRSAERPSRMRRRTTSKRAEASQWSGKSPAIGSRETVTPTRE